MEDNVYQLEVKRANVVLGSGQEINETIWGTIIGDISRQKDLQTELDNIKGSIPDITKINQDINHLKEEKADKSEIPNISGLATKTELSSSLNGLNEKINQKANKADVYTKEEVDGKITAIPKPDLSAYSTTVENDKKYQPKGNYLTSIPAEYVTETELASKGYITDISGKADKSSVYTKSEIDTKLGNIDTLLDQINGEVI